MKKKNSLEKHIKKEWKNLLFNSIFAILSVVIIILFHKNILLATSLEIILGVVGLLKWKSKITLMVFFIGGIWGPIAEMAVIYFSGAWAYDVTNLFTLIPSWLIFVWANAAVFIYETSKEIKKFGIKK